MFQNQALNVLFYVLSTCGLGGIIAGIVIRFLGRKIDKSDKAAEERQQAMIQCMVLVQEGRSVNSRAIHATAEVVRKEHGFTAELTEAMKNLDDYERREADNTRKKATEFIYGQAVAK